MTKARGPWWGRVPLSFALALSRGRHGSAVFEASCASVRTILLGFRRCADFLKHGFPRAMGRDPGSNFAPEVSLAHVLGKLLLRALPGIPLASPPGPSARDFIWAVLTDDGSSGAAGVAWHSSSRSEARGREEQRPGDSRRARDVSGWTSSRYVYRWLVRPGHQRPRRARGRSWRSPRGLLGAVGVSALIHSASP